MLPVQCDGTQDKERDRVIEDVMEVLRYNKLAKLHK